MIQATDFVCPTCKAQCGKPCVNFEQSFAYGKTVNKPVHRFGKPHPDRLRLAKAKRKEQSNVQ